MSTEYSNLCISHCFAESGFATVKGNCYRGEGGIATAKGTAAMRTEFMLSLEANDSIEEVADANVNFTK